MKNYLFSGLITEVGKQLLKVDLVKAKRLVAIAAGQDFKISDKYFFQGTDKYVSTVSIFNGISSISDFVLLDNIITGTKAQDILMSADVIYLVGGDPRIQLKYIQDNNLVDIIKSFKGIIVGVSAGSMNQAKLVYYRKEPSNPITHTYEGLGLVDISIDPHYDVNDSEIVAETKEWKRKMPIVALPEESFLVVENARVRYYGEHY